MGLRISGDEQYEDGFSKSATLDTIKHVSSDIDYVSLVDGTSATLGGSVHIVPPMYYEPGYVAPF